tara:strand:+ start:777 stop:1184 length:408 start_codon:yes stop_codon:yes gene_type:complete
MINQQKNYTRWFNVDWKIILKRKLSNKEHATVMSILTNDLQEEGITLENAGHNWADFAIGDDFTFPKNYRATLENHTAVFYLNFTFPNMNINIRHISGDKDLTDLIEEYLSTEQDLINRMIRAISKDTTGDVAYG